MRLMTTRMFIFKSFGVRDLYNQKRLPYAVAQGQVLQESSLIQLKYVWPFYNIMHERVNLTQNSLP